jgi:hypothetical protein
LKTISLSKPPRPQFNCSIDFDFTADFFNRIGQEARSARPLATRLATAYGISYSASANDRGIMGDGSPPNTEGDMAKAQRGLTTAIATKAEEVNANTEIPR